MEEMTIVDVIDKIKQFNEVTDMIHQKVVNGYATRDAEIARQAAIIAAFGTAAATSEQIQEVFTKLDETMEKLIRVVPGTITGPGGDPD